MPYRVKQALMWAGISALLLGAAFHWRAHIPGLHRQAPVPLWQGVACSASQSDCQTLLHTMEAGGIKPAMVIMPAMRVHWLGDEVQRSRWPATFGGYPVWPRIEFQGQIARVNVPKLLNDIVAIASNQSGQGMPQGLFIDYRGLPNSLPAYVDFLEQLRARLPDQVDLMVSVMPAWLDAREFPDVQSFADKLVLQTTNLADPGKGMFAGEDLLQLARRLNTRAHVPYYMALPTQAEQVFRDGMGHLIGTQQYPSDEDLKPVGGRVNLRAFADPVEVQQLIQSFNEARPSRLEGVIWQVDRDVDDDMAWQAQTLQKVVQGLPWQPAWRLTVSADADASSGQYQLTLVNDSPVDAAMPRTIWLPQQCNGFSSDNRYRMIKPKQGELPRLRLPRLVLMAPGESLAVGTLRCDSPPVMPEQAWQINSGQNQAQN